MSDILPRLAALVERSKRTYVVAHEGQRINSNFSRRLLIKDVLAILCSHNLNEFKKEIKEIVDSLTDDDLRLTILKEGNRL